MKRNNKILLIYVLIFVFVGVVYFMTPNNVDVISSNVDTFEKITVAEGEEFVSLLEVSLSNEDMAELDECIAECERIFSNGSSTDAIALMDALEALDFKYGYFEEQLATATLLYYYDLSDKKLEDDYLFATQMWESARTKIWDFYNSSREENKALTSLIQDFINKTYPDRMAYNEDPNQYLHEISNAKNEMLSYNGNASYEEAIKPFNKFLYASLRYAQAFGYNNYYDYASDVIYNREYTKYERKIFREYVKEYLVPLYKKYENESDDSYYSLSNRERALSDDYLYSPFESLRGNYLFEYFDSLPDGMGTVMREAFELDRVLIGDRENSYQTANVSAIGDVPVCYFPKNKSDLTTVSHELGHYYADVAGVDTDSISMDLSELYSQANTMLMMSFLQKEIDNDAFDSFCSYALCNQIYKIILNTVKDEFCERIFVDEYTHYHTVEELNSVMEQLIDEYGISEISSSMESYLMTFWNRQVVDGAVYHLSYAVSSMVAFQIYQMSLTDYEGAALCYRGIVENADKDGAFLKTILKNKLLSPFDKKAFRIWE